MVVGNCYLRTRLNRISLESRTPSSPAPNFFEPFVLCCFTLLCVVFYALTSFVQKPFYHFNFLDSYRDLVFTCCGGEQFSCLIFYTVKQHFLNHLSLSPNGRTFPLSGPVDTSLQIDTFHSTISREIETSQFSSGRAPRNVYARNSNICGSLDGLFV